MPSWFDLKTLDMYGPEDRDGIEKAAANIQFMIQSEISSGIPANRILVGGFSQGGALALYTGLTSTINLGGLIGLSCWLPLHKSFPAARKIDDTVPIFQCHGEADPVLPYKFGQLSHFSLKTFMKNAQFNSYPGLSHSSSPDEMNDVKVRKKNRPTNCRNFRHFTIFLFHFGSFSKCFSFPLHRHSLRNMCHHSKVVYVRRS